MFRLTVFVLMVTAGSAAAQEWQKLPLELFRYDQDLKVVASLREGGWQIAVYEPNPGNKQSFYARIRNSDGTLVTVSWRGKSVFSPKGEMWYECVVYTDKPMLPIQLKKAGIEGALLIVAEHAIGVKAKNGNSKMVYEGPGHDFERQSFSYDVRLVK